MFRLALGLGMTVSELEERMTYSELVEWIAFYRMEPWGCEVEDSRMAMQCAASIAPYSKSRVRPESFMPDRERKRLITDPKAMVAAMIVWAKMNPGLVEYKPDVSEVNSQTEHQPRG